MSKKMKKVFIAYPHYWIPLIVVAFLTTIFLIAPLIPLDPTKTNTSLILANPSAEHLFGTDDVGRDYFIRVLYGGRVSLLVGFVAMIISLFIGTSVGLISGYYGGIIDSTLMRLVDIISSIPWIILASVLTVFLKPGINTIIIIIGCFSWTEISRMIRAETLVIKEKDYVKYAQFLEERDFKIITKHILPAVTLTMIVSSTRSIASAIMLESTLSFFGLGIQQPMSSLGSLLQKAQSYLQSAPHMAFIPGILIMLMVFSFNEIGKVFRDYINMEE